MNEKAISKLVESNNFCSKKVVRAVEISPILLSHYWKNEQFKGVIIIVFNFLGH